VNDTRAALIVLLLGAPEVLEGAEGSKNGSTDPDGVFTLRGSDNLDLHARWRERSQLLLHTIRDTREHGGSSGKDDVAVKVTTDIKIALEDRVVGGFVDTSGLKTEEGGLEEGFGGTEALISNSDDLSIREFIALLKGRGLSSGLEFLLEVKGDVAELLLDVTDNFTLGGGGEGITTLHQVLDEEVSQVTTSKIETEDGVGESETFVDGDSVGDTITGIENDTGRSSRGVEGKDGLDGNVEGGGVESLKHDLGHLFTVSLGVKGGLSKEDGVLLRGDTELIVESVMPDLLHVIPVGDDTVLNGILEGKDTTLGLSLITNIRVLLAHSNHHTLVTGTTND